MAPAGAAQVYEAAPLIAAVRLTTEFTQAEPVEAISVAWHVRTETVTLVVVEQPPDQAYLLVPDAVRVTLSPALMVSDGAAAILTEQTAKH